MLVRALLVVQLLTYAGLAVALGVQSSWRLGAAQGLLLIVQALLFWPALNGGAL